MLHLIPKTNIDFVGKRYIFFALSALFLLSGLASLVIKGGPKWGLDFTGGTLVEVKFKNNSPKLEEVRNALGKADVPSFEIQSVAGSGVFIIRTQVQNNKSSSQDAGVVILNALQAAFPQQQLDILRKEFVGPTVGKHLARQTLVAFLLTFLGIIIYVAFRFHSGVWGFSGVLALIHDVMAVVGVFSIVDKEISVTVVAALLTIAGFSINDTIVIFDYMRDRLKLRRTEGLDEVINRSLNDTLSRTIITSLTVFMASITLFLFGGEVLHDFAEAMLIGVLVGVYSSVAIAAPIIYEWQIRRDKKRLK